MARTGSAALKQAAGYHASANVEPWIYKNSPFSVAGMGRELNRTTTGRLNNGVPQVPPPCGASDLSAFRLSLPVAQMKEVIVKAINDNRVVLVSGETGSGKTTQVGRVYTAF